MCVGHTFEIRPPVLCDIHAARTGYIGSSHPRRYKTPFLF